LLHFHQILGWRYNTVPVQPTIRDTSRFRPRRAYHDSSDNAEPQSHKLLTTAREMYGAELSSLSLSDISGIINDLNFKSENIKKTAQKRVKKL